MKNRTRLIIALSVIISSSCYEETFFTAGEGLEDWTTATHGASAAPNYEAVFPEDKVNEFLITIAAEDWESMQNNLTSIYGSGTRPGGDFPDITPDYFPCDIAFSGKNWYNVGIRYKGNSSLQASSRGAQKLPFRFDFDNFEDDFPEITNQSFYGFPALSFSSNYDDKSFLREKTANYLYARSGVPAPSSAFYKMYINYGEGPVYFGLYTAVEIVFETMLNKEFGSESGNCYKPEDNGATFSSIGFSLSDFENKTTGGTGEDDIQELYETLHSALRLSDLESWKDDLEAVFDVQGFLNWLAVNTTIQNWDTYGRMSHNYYLYHDPQDDLIKWIPWDNNEAFQEGKREGALDFSFSNLDGGGWPLIDLIASVPEYNESYKNYIRSFTEGAFSQSNMTSFYSTLKEVVSDAVQEETPDYSYISNYSDFETAINILINHNEQRVSAANQYIQ